MEDSISAHSLTDLAYTAGIIDGEGSILILRGTGYNRKGEKYKRYGCRVSVGMTDKLVPEWLHKNFGGCFYSRQMAKNWKDQYIWMITSRTVGSFISAILPFLKTKKKQALLVLEYLDHVQENNPEYRELMVGKMKELNRKGKPVTTNTLDGSPEPKIESELTGDRESAPAVTQVGFSNEIIEKVHPYLVTLHENPQVSLGQMPLA